MAPMVSIVFCKWLVCCISSAVVDLSASILVTFTFIFGGNTLYRHTQGRYWSPSTPIRFCQSTHQSIFSSTRTGRSANFHHISLPSATIHITTWGDTAKTSVSL